MIHLGDRVRDIVTGYEGVTTSRHEYLNGCVRYCVERGKPDKSGVEELHFDEQRLSVINENEVTGGPQGLTTGGDRPTPPRTGAT